MEGGSQTLPLLSVPAKSSPEKRLFVYQNAYVARLIEILGEDFDMTWTFAGDQLFYDLARKFIDTHPSNTPNARWFSHRFPEFIMGEDVHRDAPAIAEIAQLERALGDAFDAADGPVMDRADLETGFADGGTQKPLRFHPSVALLRMASNAYDIFNALRKSEAPPEMAVGQEDRWVLIWRQDLTCRHLELEPEQGILLDHALRGYSFERLCEVLMTLADPDSAAYRMAGYLGGWIDSGFLLRFDAKAGEEVGKPLTS